MHKTVVSTQMPYTIWSVGEDFQRLFHYSTTDILEQSLLKLTGPRTDLLLLRTSIESYGSPTKRDLIEKCFILYSQTGENRKILVSFDSYIECGNTFCLLGFKEADNDCAENSDINHANSMQQRCTFTIPETSSFKKSSERQSFLESPLIITPILLQSLRGISLPHAAQAVGISVYAFKRACRQLGIRRWPYTRGPNQHNKRPAGVFYSRKVVVATTRTCEESMSCYVSPDEGSFAEILGDCRVDEVSTPCECLADGCRALEEEWSIIRAGISEAARAPWGFDALADDRLALDMLKQRWQ